MSRRKEAASTPNNKFADDKLVTPKRKLSGVSDELLKNEQRSGNAVRTDSLYKVFQ